MRKPDPEGPRVLLAGDAADLPAMRQRLGECDPRTAGIVFVEVLSPLQIVRLDGPAGVAVHWLFRERRRGPIALRGEVLVGAVDAWLDEWMRADGGTRIEIWLGARTSSIVNAYARDLEHELAATS
ncbi:SIP domain-containing protein [Agromyces protaetiae]|nr:SIP domain-containing protein [Agromyces protaetiae]